MVESVKRPTSAQAMISWFVSSSPVSGSVLTAQSLETALAEKGKPAVLITVTKQPNTGTIELTEKLEAALADLQKNLPKEDRKSVV